MRINEILTEGSDERKQAALWAQITKHEQAAKKSKDLKQQHHLKMADQLRSQLKTNDLEEGWRDTATLLGAPVVAGALAVGAQHIDDQKPHVQVGGQNAMVVQYDSSRIPNNAMILKGADGKMYRVWQQSGKGMNKMTLASPVEPLKEFASDDGDGRPKYIPWVDFIEGVKGIVGKEFDCVENVVKSTIKARFVPHDSMEFGPTMLYSYYETRAGGRNKGAISTRGSIQVGKYYPNTSGLGDRNFITGFNLLKGHPFERHFDLTPENISKIASIILGNTEGAYRMPQQQVNELAPPEDNDEDDDIEVPHYDRLRRAVWREGLSKVKPQKFATFKLENKGKIHSCYGISADGVEVKIFTTPSKEVAEDIYTAYMIRNQG
jgi:hypothetical protein